MGEPDRFRVNRPDVIDETLDGELVVVNLRSGAYYSLDPVGAVVWQGVARASTRGEILRQMLARFEGDASVIEAATGALLDELRSELLIVPNDGAGTLAEAAPVAARAPFATPRLQKYTDMQDLLLLDPIHEVDAGGWPTRGT